MPSDEVAKSQVLGRVRVGDELLVAARKALGHRSAVGGLCSEVSPPGSRRWRSLLDTVGR